MAQKSAQSKAEAISQQAGSQHTARKELNLFRVKVRSERGLGEEQEIYVQASSSEEIRNQYEPKGYVVLKVHELASRKPVTFAKIGSQEKAEFCYLLADLLQAGITFKQALNTILVETCRPIADAIPIIIKDLDEGRTVIEAFRRHPGVFDEVMMAVLQTAEKSGEWSVPLGILARSFEKDYHLRNTVKLALLYPLVVIVIALVIVSALAFYSFPNFVRIYTELGLSLPFSTRVTMGVVGFLNSKGGFLFALGSALAGFGLWRYYHTEAGKLRFQSTVVRIKPIGKILEGQSIAIFSRTLGILVGAGGLLHTALGVAARSTTLEKHRRALLGMVAPIRGGEDPAVALDMNYAFTPSFKQQFIVGATTGRLDTSLMRIAEFYEKEVDRQIAKLTKLIEPILIVVLGALIAWLVISMYMPLFSLLRTMGR